LSEEVKNLFQSLAILLQPKINVEKDEKNLDNYLRYRIFRHSAFGAEHNRYYQGKQKWCRHFGYYRQG
jgi:hypothetical protein